MPDVAAAPSAPSTPTASQQIGVSDAQFMKNFNLEGLMPTEDAGLPEPVEAAKKKEKKPVEAPAPEVVDDPETPVEEPPVETPPAEEPAPTETPAAEKPKPAVPFKVFDKDGELDIPAIELTFTANGKERREPLDKVIQLAQRGYYNEEREQENIQTRSDNQRVTRENLALQQYVDSIQQDLTALFNDQQDGLYLSLKAQYAQHNTPEAQLARTQQQLQSIQQQQQDSALQQQVSAFAVPLQNHLVALSTQHPNVPVEEIIGRFTVLTAPFLQAGRVPPSKFQQVAQIVDQELTPWVQHTHDSRQSAKSQQDQITQERIKRETQAATAKTVLAKRQLARAIPGTAGTTATKLREQPPAPKYQKAGDILNDINRLVATSTG